MAFTPLVPDPPGDRSVPSYRYPCAQCGAELRFEPGQTRLTCDFCGFEQPIVGAQPTPGDSPATAPWGRAAQRSGLGELDYRTALRDALPGAAMEETRVLSCPNCGAQIQFEGADHASECPFCATPVITDSGTARHLKPQALVPFALTEGQARGAMATWLGQLWFAPNGLRDYARRGRKLDGMYVPYWTYDADTRTQYRGMRGDAYYETRTMTVNGKQQQVQVRQVRWRSAAGQVARAFDDVLVMASTSLPRNYADGLQPWDLSALTIYRPDYLAGFRAEGYTVSLEDGHAIARQAMDGVIAADIRADIGGDEQRIDAAETALANETFKHILLPVWMAAYKYRGRSFRFIVNAQTGKVQGERPWSAWKIAFAVLLALIVLGAVAVLGNVEEWSQTMRFR